MEKIYLGLAKYPKATECLLKNEKELSAFYDFSGEHWIHLRTTNPIESNFAMVKHRTRKSRNCFSRNTIIAATYKLFLEAEKGGNLYEVKTSLPKLLIWKNLLMEFM